MWTMSCVSTTVAFFIKNANFKVLITKLKKNILREHDLFKDNF